MHAPPSLDRPPARAALAAVGLLFALSAALSVTGCGIPHDQRGTLARVRGDTLRVGVTEHPPFIVHTGEGAAGVEADLVRAFADSIGAAVAWHWGPVSEHVAALERLELDLLAAGLGAKEPTLKRVATTMPYYRGHEAIGAPPDAPVPESWEGVAVAVARGSALAARVETAGAVPVRIARPGAASGFRAAPDWALRGWGLRPVRDLAPARYVLAVAPGENGFLHALDRFLDGRRGPLARALARAAAVEARAPSGPDEGGR